MSSGTLYEAAKRIIDMDKQIQAEEEYSLKN